MASYQSIAEHGWAMVSYDSEENIYENVHKNMRILGLICIIFVLIISVLAFITIAISVRPLLYVEDVSQYSLYTHYGISRAQIQRLKTNQSVTTHTLNVILNILGEGFTLNDIAEFTPDEKEEE